MSERGTAAICKFRKQTEDITPHHAALAQLVVRHLAMVEVTSSSLVCRLLRDRHSKYFGYTMIIKRSKQAGSNPTTLSRTFRLIIVTV